MSLCVHAPIVVGLHRVLELLYFSLYLSQVGILGNSSPLYLGAKGLPPRQRWSIVRVQRSLAQ